MALSRKGIPILLGAMCLGISVVVLLAADKPSNSKAADWPLFRGNGLQTGVANSRLPDRLEIRWTFQSKEDFEGTAAIVGDTVYAAALDGNLYALKLANGSLKWTYKGGPFKAPVAVHGGAVHVGDEDGVFHCVDAVSGKKRWTYETNSEITSGANFAGDNILFGSEDQHLYCLSKDGKRLWKFKVPGGPVMATPAVVGDRTFVTGCDSKLHVLDVGKGKELAQVDIGGQTGASSAVAGDNLYVGTMNNQFLAIDWKKPRVEWSFEAARRPKEFFAAAAVTDKLIITGSRDKIVRALDRKDGKEKWSFPTGGKVDSSPVVVGKRVYVGSLDGNLYVLDLARGTLVQKVVLGKEIAASPAVAGNCLVIGTRGGVLYCLGKK